MKLFKAGLTTILLLLSGAAFADTGEAYSEMKTPLPKLMPGDDRTEVVMFFAHTCPYCRQIESIIDRRGQWLKAGGNEHVFITKPVQFHEGDALPRFYYAAQLMGIEKRVQPALFALGADIAKGDISKSISDEDIAKRIGKELAGVDGSQLLTLAGSFQAKAKARAAMQQFLKSGLQGVPVFVVDGKYMIDGQTAGGLDNVLGAIEKALHE